jgi:hypothetical protein
VKCVSRVVLSVCSVAQAQARTPSSRNTPLLRGNTLSHYCCANLTLNAPVDTHTAANMFRVPDSDDLPSTPPHDHNAFFNPPKSTTPGHEPPTYLSNVSTTPPGPPPRSVYASSFNANNTFPRPRGTPLKGFTLPPQSSPPREDDEDAEGEDDDLV